MEAIKLIGTSEVPGIKNNPAIMGWAKELLIQDIYDNDDTAWCGLFVPNSGQAVNHCAIMVF